MFVPVMPKHCTPPVAANAIQPENKSKGDDSCPFFFFFFTFPESNRVHTLQAISQCFHGAIRIIMLLIPSCHPNACVCPRVVGMECACASMVASVSTHLIIHPPPCAVFQKLLFLLPWPTIAYHPVAQSVFQKKKITKLKTVTLPCSSLSLV